MVFGLGDPSLCDYWKRLIASDLGWNNYKNVKDAEYKKAGEAEAETEEQKYKLVALLAVPVDYDEDEKEALKEGITQTGEIYSLEVEDIVDEPIAAVAAYAYEASNEASNGNILVYDLGGGKCTVSIVKIRNGVFSIRYSSTDYTIGGQFFNDELVKIAIEKFED